VGKCYTTPTGAKDESRWQVANRDRGGVCPEE